MGRCAAERRAGASSPKGGFEVLLVASKDFRHWVQSRDLPFTGLSANIQAILDSLSNASNFMAAVRTIRDLAELEQLRPAWLPVCQQ